VAFGAHARIDQDLRHRVPSGGRLFFFIRTRQVLNEIDRVVVGNVLQTVGNTLDKVVLLDDCHYASL
jgi:hypothetical protein